MLPRLRSAPGGYLFPGPSETINGFDFPLEGEGNNVSETRLKTANSSIFQVYLKAGEIYVADSPTVITTVLGSCLSVTMFSPRHRVGAICHAVLPSEKGFCWDARYVDSSIMMMLKDFARLSIDRSALQVKMYGGADVGYLAGEGKTLSVGSRNIVAALRVIAEQKLAVAASDLGGVRGRKITFLAHTGEVILQSVPISEELWRPNQEMR